jgi:hypothetical protein
MNKVIRSTTKLVGRLSLSEYFTDNQFGIAQQLSAASSSSNDFIMNSRPHAAVVANAKIFPVYANRLASHDVDEYINTANKLKNWLGSEKAYYPDALRNVSIRILVQLDRSETQ